MGPGSTPRTYKWLGVSGTCGWPHERCSIFLKQFSFTLYSFTPYSLSTTRVRRGGATRYTGSMARARTSTAYWTDNHRGGPGFQDSPVSTWELGQFGHVPKHGSAGDDALYDEMSGPHSPQMYSRTPAYGFVEEPEIEAFLEIQAAMVQVQHNYAAAIAEDPTLVTKSKRKWTDEQLLEAAPRAHSLMHLCQMLGCSTSNYQNLRNHLKRLNLFRPCFMTPKDRRRVREDFERRTIVA